MSRREAVFLPAGSLIKLQTDQVSRGSINRESDRVGGSPYPPISIHNANVLRLGPFSEPRRYTVTSTTGAVKHTIYAKGYEISDKGAQASALTYDEWLQKIKDHPMDRTQEDLISYFTKEGILHRYLPDKDAEHVNKLYEEKKALRAAKP